MPVIVSGPRRRSRRRRTIRWAPGSPARRPRSRGARPPVRRRRRGPSPGPAALPSGGTASSRSRATRVGRRAGQLARARRAGSRARTAGCGCGPGAGSSARRRPVAPHERVAPGAAHEVVALVEAAVLERDDALLGARLRLTRRDDLRSRRGGCRPRTPGSGKTTSSNPRLATVVPWVVSSTEMPTSRPRVKRLFTRGRPNSVPAAYSASRWSRAGFIVIVVKRTLSVSVIGARERMRDDEADGEIVEPASVMRGVHSRPSSLVVVAASL